MKRREFLGTATSAVAVAVTGLGSTDAAPPSTGPGTTTPSPPSQPTVPAPGTAALPAGQSGPGLSLLTLHASQTGTLPYLATVYPLEGSVRAGRIVESPDDPALRSSVLSAWPDGSAQVVVLAGEAAVTSGGTRSIRLHSGVARGKALTTAAIAARLDNIRVDFGGGTKTLTNFAAGYDFVWWANAAVICARYRLPCGRGAMEAVIDLHAFSSGRVFVEVVIENGRVNAAAATVTAPGTETYTNATVAVNGTTIATVSSPTAGMRIPRSRRVIADNQAVSGVFAGGHEAFRAWYCSTWIGGDPGIEVTHDTASLQSHPWFFKPAVDSSQDMQSKYAQAYDSYVPWATCRLRMPGMSGGGDDEQIAMLTEEQSDYVITGDKHARRAVLATGLACHTAAFNWRHTNGRLPTRAQMTGKNVDNNHKWPRTTTKPAWGGDVGGTVDGSHVPSVGLVPFLCRPSPCFIEVAQKEFCWHATNYNSRDAATHPFDQVRSRAWRLRNYAGAIFLTPDEDYDGTGRKDSLRAALKAAIAVNNGFLDQPWNTLKLIYGLDKTSLNSRASNFMNLFCVMAWSTIERVKVLRGGDQAAWTTMCDKFVDYPVRYINQATSGEWRAILYQQYMGEIVGSMIAMGDGNFGERNRITYGSVVPEASGPWLMDPGDGTVTNWATMRAVSRTPRWPNSYNYDAIFWSALCAAVERGGKAADTAWNRVINGITNLDTWKVGFRTYPRFNRWPRNK